MNEVMFQYREAETFIDSVFNIKSDIVKDYILEVNSFGYRSDEFKNDHGGVHLLFSGCSNTFGIGLKKEECWSWKTYQKITEKNITSGYFNLGSPGASIQEIIINLFKYFKNYGNPNYIFLNLPNHTRFFLYNQENNKFLPTVNDFDNYNSARLINYQYYLMLEQYCNSNNIKLYSLSWDHENKDVLLNFNNKNQKNMRLESTNKIFKKYNFTTFYITNIDSMSKEIAELKEKYNSSVFYVARDIIHFGEGSNIYWSNLMYDFYMKDADER
jgi:hypothetical protein